MSCEVPGRELPLIGIAPRYQHPEPTLQVPEQLAPEEAIASVFVDAIVAAGGMPALMPITTDAALIARYVELCDGFAIPGGHDVDPALWGEQGCASCGALCPERDAFELELVRQVVAADKPLFATCRGAQILNVALGGTLCMDVPSLGAPEGMVQWRHTMILSSPAHPVEVEAGSLLERALGGARHIQANSSHHCCVGELGRGVRLVARATDGVPEAIELAGKRFVLGVQWHPEYTWPTLDSDFSLWKSFVAACRQGG